MRSSGPGPRSSGLRRRARCSMCLLISSSSAGSTPSSRAGSRLRSRNWRRSRPSRGRCATGGTASRARSKRRRGTSRRIHNPAVKQRARGVTERDMRRAGPYAERRKKQLRLPLFPTTTNGSFPQTAEVRAARKKLHEHTMTAVEYDAFIAEQITRTLKLQEELGLDVLVHGEFERNDMVEYFGEQLEGFAFTEHGWVQSYGTRYVKPPIIYGDVSRPRAMTVRWSTFAQSKTARPVKGMLTGPVTILQCSFVRDDQPRAETAKQLALAIRDEV